LIRAAEIGQEAGLRHVYAGNLPGHVGEYEDTRCPSCGGALIERVGFAVVGYHLTADGSCPRCKARLPGIWTDDPQTVRLTDTADLFFRGPRRVR